jgi:hypothetical protein
MLALNMTNVSLSAQKEMDILGKLSTQYTVKLVEVL